MGVRPPSNGDGREPDSIEFGIAAVDARLRDARLEFPASSDDVAAEIGQERIPYDVPGNAVPLREVLAEVDRTRFESRQELLNELHPVFEAYRERHSNSIVRQVRSLLPF